uniref:Protein phosphatase 1 regulatory subunit 3D n=1 Tax=Falco tinnunculus TaxID=100819 RepID=A0A8C4TQX3_FALTI
MEVRGPRRNPSYLSDLYQNMLRAEEARGRGQQQPPAVHTSSSKALWSSTLAKGGPQPSKLQSSTSPSCDPALRPIIRRRARSLPTSPERRKRAAAQCQVPGCQSRINRVRFADALGLELTEVKVFQTGEDPSIPLHVLSRLSINSDLWCSSSDLEFSMQCLVPDFQQPADSMDFSSRLQEQQFEKLLDEVTRKKDFRLLEQFVAAEDCENASHKCSNQFVNKLDKLLCWELDKQEVKTISTLLNSVQKCWNKISIAGEDGVPAMIKHGFIGRISKTI